MLAVLRRSEVPAAGATDRLSVVVWQCIELLRYDGQARLTELCTACVLSTLLFCIIV